MNFINITQMMIIIKMNAPHIQQTMELIYSYLIEKKNIVIRISHCAKLIALIKVMIKLINSQYVIAKLKQILNIYLI